MQISLHHLAITETTPAEFVEIAAALRCDHMQRATRAVEGTRRILAAAGC